MYETLLAALLTQAQVNRLEDQIDTLYKVIAYTIPLATALGLSISAAVYVVMRRVKENTRNIGVVAGASNGKLDTLSRQVSELQGHVLNGQAQGESGNATSKATGSDHTGRV